MKIIARIAVILSVLLAVGCTTFQPAVNFDDQFWQTDRKTVGILYTPPEEAGFYMEGDVRLLDYAINAAANSKLSAHAKSLDISDFHLIVDEVTLALQNEGFTVKLVNEDIDTGKLKKFVDPDKEDTTYFASKDYTPMADSQNVDYLLLLRTKRVGFARPYQGFIPLEDPRSVFEVHGEVVDLSSNQLIWYKDIDESSISNGTWNEPPTFPGLTNGFYIALESARQRIIQEMKRTPPLAESAETELSQL